MSKKVSLLALVLLLGCRAPAASRDDDTKSAMQLAAGGDAKPAQVSAVSVTSASPAASPARAPFDASKLKIVEGKTGTDPVTGYLHLYGVVKNETGVAVENVKIMIDLFDTKGAPLGVEGWHKVAQKEAHAGEKERALGHVFYLPPGASAPYHYLRDPKKLAGAYGSHKLVATANASRGPRASARIDAMSTRVVPDGHGEVTLTGTFTNGALPCRSPEAYFGFFEGDKLVDLVTPHRNALDAYFQKSLTAGQTVPFVGKSFPKAPAGARVETWAACDVQGAE